MKHNKFIKTPSSFLPLRAKKGLLVGSMMSNRAGTAGALAMASETSNTARADSSENQDEEKESFWVYPVNKSPSTIS